MNKFSEYVVTLFTASLVAGIGERIAPAAMRKYVTFVASLILLIFLFTPIQSLGEELFNFADDLLHSEQSPTTQDGAYDEIFNLSKRKAEEAIQGHLSDRFGIREGIEVSITMHKEENGTILLTHISLTLRCNDQQLANEIETYLEKTFNTETSVILS